MTFSLYDAVVPSNLQILGALDRIMEKAKAFCDERSMTQAELIDARLAADMLPLGYQVKSCVVHSIGGIEGTIAGSFSPDRSAWPTDFAGLRDILQRASAELPALVLAAKLLFPRNNRLRDPAGSGRDARQARLHWNAAHRAMISPISKQAAICNSI